MTWYEALFFTLTLWAALAAIIEGEQNRKPEAVLFTWVAATSFFVALMLG